MMLWQATVRVSSPGRSSQFLQTRVSAQTGTAALLLLRQQYGDANVVVYPVRVQSKECQGAGYEDN